MVTRGYRQQSRWDPGLRLFDRVGSIRLGIYDNPGIELYGGLRTNYNRYKMFSCVISPPATEEKKKVKRIVLTRPALYGDLAIPCYWYEKSRRYSLWETSMIPLKTEVFPRYSLPKPFLKIRRSQIPHLVPIIICVCSRKNELEWIHVVNKRIDLVDKEERH